jgi:predicted amidohydrolase YtcJ
MKTSLIFAITVLLTACDTPEESDTAPADQIYFGGDILTMAGDSPEYVEALVVTDGSISFLGTREQAFRHGSESTEKIDLKGLTLMPGFVDAHSHLMQTAGKLGTIALDPPPAGTVRSIADIVARLQAELSESPPAEGEWLIGWGFDNGMLAERRFPTRFDLDEVSETIPIALIHFSSHMLVMNSAGLARAGYTAAYVDPEGGLIRRVEASREPDGVIEETAMFQAFATLSRDYLGPDAGVRLGLPFADDKLLPLILEAQEKYLRQGFTTITEFAASPGDLALLQKLRDQGKLKADLITHMHTSAAPLDWVKQQFSRDYDRHLRVGGGKINLDGGSPGRTAFLRSPYYTPSPGRAADYRGYSSINDQTKLNALVDSYYEARVPVFIHALGDAALDQAIAAVSYAELHNPYEDIRTQLIHLQVAQEDQFDALKELDVSLTFQITHNYYFADFHNEKTLGPVRTARLNALQSALQRDLSVSLHHDSPVHPVDQLMLVWIAANRQGRSGAVYGPDQRISVYEALRSSTIETAWQFQEENRKGSLEVGKLADLIILSQNPLQVPAGELRDIQVLETIKEGVTIWRQD